MNTFAIEDLRRMVRYFNNLDESFNQRFCHMDLRKIWAFASSEQGGRVHECADCWPRYLLAAVLGGALGAQMPEKLIERAAKEAA